MVCMVGKMHGTRCRDGVKVLWCPSLHALVFLQKTFCDLFLLLFFCIVVLEWYREERWEEKTRGQLFCSHKTKNHHKLKCFQVKWEIHTSHFFIYGSFGLINPPLTSCGILFGSAHSIEL